MKNMTKTIALLLATLAAGNSAQAQEGRLVAADKSYIFSSTTDADGTGNITYQWFRDGVAIPNATGEIYVLPAYLAQGERVEFKRGAMSTTCAGNISYSNVFVVTFCKGLLVGSLCWADRNVDDYQTFAIRPDMYTKFFQWNRTMAWVATGSVTGWNSNADNSTIWTNNPCPAGWRLPAMTELLALHSGSVPVGGTWRGTDVRGNAVAGRFYGPNSADCSLPNNMDGCIFLPAGGYRGSSGAIANQSTYGGVWSGTQASIASGGQSGNTSGLTLYFNSSSGNLSDNSVKSSGFNVRCVR